MGMQRGLASAGERERVGIGSGRGQGMRGSISSCIRVISSFTGKDEVIDNSGQKKKRLADAKRFHALSITYIRHILCAVMRKAAPFGAHVFIYRVRLSGSHLRTFQLPAYPLLLTGGISELGAIKDGCIGWAM